MCFGKISILRKMCSCFLELCPLKKLFWSENNLKYKQDGNIFFISETLCFYVFFVELLWCERIAVALKDIDHLFNIASEIIEADDTRIDDNEYLRSLENGTKLIVCAEEQIQKLLIYLELERYLSFKKISYPLDIDHFLWYSK